LEIRITSVRISGVILRIFLYCLGAEITQSVQWRDNRRRWVQFSAAAVMDAACLEGVKRPVMQPTHPPVYPVGAGNCF